MNDKKYLLLLLFLPVYLISFYLVETYIDGSAGYWSSYIHWDDLIPFKEWFVIPYILWYPFLLIPGLYLLFKDVPVFKKYVYTLILTMMTCIITYVIFPNGQDLRPEYFENTNVLTAIVGWLYSTDTNMNVFPMYVELYALPLRSFMIA